MEGIDEHNLDDEEATKLANRQKEAGDAGRVAAKVGMDLIDLIVKGVIANQKAQEANNDGKKILERIAKARGRQYVDIVDFDVSAKKIVFRKKVKDGIGTTEVNGEESAG